MNHVYRLVWSRVLHAWVVASENARGRGKGSGKTLATAALTLSAVVAHAGPAGGQVTSGNAGISQSGSTTTVTQSTPTASLRWQSFNTAAGETVNFIQPSASSIAVNRILGTSGTEFFGRLNANGQVYLVNPNGILFGSTAQVNVGGLVASTLDLNDASLAGNARTFSGSGTGRVVNKGTLQGRYVALLGNSVVNRGTIRAPGGAVAMGAGSTVTVTFADNDLVKLNIDRSTVNALADNGGLIQADGGRVLLSAGARDTVLASVVNNTGVIEARTVENREGTIVLLGGMAAGQVNVAGTLDASAPAGGNGGFIETSAAHVKVADTVRVSTRAGSGGRHGTWLIDPVDFTIAAQGGDLSGAALSAQLGNGNVVILSTQGSASGNGDIHVNDAVSWSADTTLELSAVRNININKSITATGNAAGLVLTPNNTGAGTGDYFIAKGAKITLSGSTPTLRIAGVAYTVINNSGGAGTAAAALQNMNADLAGRYALGEDIDLASIANFTPIGPTFTGTLAGLGHSIDHLTITSVPSGYAGLIATNGGTVRDLSLLNVAVAGGTTASSTGALTGLNNGGISNVTASGTVSSSTGNVGGMVGINNGSMTQAGADVAVTGPTGGYNAGGLVGSNGGAMTDVHATGPVSGYGQVGGLAGISYGTITRAYASGAVTGNYYVGGLVGYTGDNASITNAYATGSVTGTDHVGGLVGYNQGTITNAYASGAVSGTTSYVGGLVGRNGDAGGYSYSCGRSTCYYSYSYPGYVSSAYWDTQTTGQATAGYNYSGSISATGRTTAQSMAQSTYAGWDFTDTWVLYEGNTRPLLRSFMTPLTVTASSATKTYDGQAYSGGNGVSYSTTPDANLLGTVGYGGTSQGATNAGSYAITPTGLYSSQQGYVITFASGSLTVDPAAITVSTGNVTKTYDGNTSATGTAVVASGTLHGTDSLGGGSYAFTDKNAGSGNKTVTVSGVTVNDGNGGGNYVVSYADNTTSTIDPAVLTATMTAANKTYDGNSTAAATFTITGGLVGTETVTASGVAGFASKNAGTGKTVTSTSVTLADGTNGGRASNYTLAAGQTAQANITPKAATVSGITAADKVYDGNGTANVNTAGAVFGGLVAGDDVQVSATGTFATKNVGSNKTVTLTSSYSGAEAGNYAITGQASTTASITPRAVTVSGITAGDKVYDGGTAAIVQTGGAAFTGLVASDDVQVSATGTFTNKNVGTGKTVNLVSSFSGADAANYAIAGQATTTASITPKALTVSGITAGNKVYDGGTTAILNTGGAAFSGLVASDDVQVSATGTFANRSVGTGKTVNLSSSFSGADAGNYTITGQASTTASITPKALTVSGITAADKVYDGGTTASINTVGAVYGGLVAGDAVSVSATGTFANRNVGTGKTVTLASSYTGGDVGNYTITGQASTTASITPKALTVSGITAADKVYDGGTVAGVSTAGAVLGGLVAGDAVSVSATGAFANRDVGTGKTVTLASSYTGGDVGNYTIAGQASTTASITPKALTVSGITAADKVYDGSTAARVTTTGAVLGGLVVGDDVSVSATGTFANKNAGTGKIVMLASTYGGVDAGNYAITGQALTTASITPRPLVVTAKPDSKVADGKPYAGGSGVTYSGYAPGETYAVLSGQLAYGGSSQGATGAGRYAITPSGLGAPNYAVRFVDGLLTITEVPFPAQWLAGALAPKQSELREPPADNAATLRLLHCNGAGSNVSDVTCSSAQRPGDPGNVRLDASGPTLRIVDGGIRLPQDTSGSNN